MWLPSGTAAPCRDSPTLQTRRDSSGVTAEPPARVPSRRHAGRTLPRPEYAPTQRVSPILFSATAARLRHGSCGGTDPHDEGDRPANASRSDRGHRPSYGPLTTSAEEAVQSPTADVEHDGSDDCDPWHRFNEKMFFCEERAPSSS